MKVRLKHILFNLILPKINNVKVLNLFIFTLFLTSLNAFGFSTTILMLENNIPLNQAPVESVYVSKSGTLNIKSMVLPCPHYPKGVFGDIYECELTQTQAYELFQTTDLSQIASIVKSGNVLLKCNTQNHPKLVPYKNQQVYHFKGPLVGFEK